MPGLIPGDRLVSNLTQRLKADPGNAAIYYSIGRAHYATFSRVVESGWGRDGEVEIYERGNGLPNFYRYQGDIYPWDSESKVKNTPDNRRHIVGAVKNLRTALDITEKPSSSTRVLADPALAHLTLGCTFESGALLASHIKLGDPYRSLTTSKQWRSAAADEYLLAFKAASRAQEKLGLRPRDFDHEIVIEAAHSFERLMPKAKEVPAIYAELVKLNALPYPSNSAITPLVLDLSGSKSLGQLLEPSQKASFDLDGSGRPQTYGWVRPTTAFLVWDPNHKGKITSGRQLFGSATWWMLWSDAYAALDALDDNRDGWLSGKELHGLALWYDKNGNGRCDPGEVIPIEQTPIVAIRTHFDAREGPSYVSSKGIVLRYGQVLPTYDWVANPLPLSGE